MVSRGSDQVVLWPQYFDAGLSRAQGRRVPAKLAVKKPDAKWVEAAAKKAGLKPELEEDAKHPSLHYKKSGRVLVAKKDSKEAVIRTVAAGLAGSK